MLKKETVLNILSLTAKELSIKLLCRVLLKGGNKYEKESTEKIRLIIVVWSNGGNIAGWMWIGLVRYG